MEVPFENLLQAFDGEEDLTRYWANPFDAHPDGAANERVSELLERILLPALARREASR